MTTLDYLASLGLQHDNRVRQLIGRASEDELDSILQGYRASAETTILTGDSENHTSVYLDTWTTAGHRETAMQLALLLDRIYLPDPALVAIHEMAKIRMQPDGDGRLQMFEELKTQVINALAVVNYLAPLIRGGALTLVPSAVIGPRRSPSDLHADDFMNEQGQILLDSPQPKLPEPIRRILPDLIHVTPAHHDLETGDVRPAEEDLPLSSLILAFDGEERCSVRHFYAIRDIREDGLLESVHLPHEHMDWTQHRNWRMSERLKLGLQRWENIRFDVMTARRLNSQLLTSLPVTRAMIQAATGVPSSNSQSEVTHLLSLQLPYFEDVSAIYLADARGEELAFDAFRRALRTAIKELKDLRREEGLGAIELMERQRDVMRRLIDEPLRQVQTRMKRISRQRGTRIALGSAGLMATIGGAVFGSDPVTFAGATGLGASVLNWLQNTVIQPTPNEVRDSSGYFYWRATGGR